MRPLLSSLLPFLLAGATCLATSAASAAAPSDANVAQASALFKEGNRLFQANEYEGARVKFASAYGLVKSDGILWNLALAEAKSGHASDALNHLRAYVKGAKARPQDVQEAQSKWIPQMEAQAGELQIDGAEGASVTVDGGDVVGVLPLGGVYAVMPGHHRIEGRGAGGGGDVASREVDVAGGQTVAVHLVAGGASGVPIVSAAPATTESPVQAQPTDVSPHEATTTSGLTTGRKIAIGVGVAAVAAAGVGVVFGIEAKSKDSDAASMRGQPSSCYQSTSGSCATLHSDGSAARSDATIANVLYVGGGVLAAGAIVTWLLSSPHEERSGLKVDPALGPGYAGLRLGGDF